MIRIVTDTASDILRHEAAAMNVDIVSLEITFDDDHCPHATEEDIQRFYQRLISSKNLPITSRPSPAAYMKIIEEAKAAGDDVLILTLSSGLSGTWESAEQAKQMAEYDRVRQCMKNDRVWVYEIEYKNDVPWGKLEDGWICLKYAKEAE